jgi:hypothetical protein
MTSSSLQTCKERKDYRKSKTPAQAGVLRSLATRLRDLTPACGGAKSAERRDHQPHRGGQRHGSRGGRKSEEPAVVDPNVSTSMPVSPTLLKPPVVVFTLYR